MAEDIADMLLASYRISQVQVRVETPRAVGKARAAGVRIVRPA
jgi:dihydroneopterin aldolase